MPHVFLSDEWLEAVKDLAGDAVAGPSDLKMNFTVTGGPEGDKELHINGAMSATAFGKGHLSDAPTKIIIPFDVAKALLVEGNPQAVMQAFMNGTMKVEGDFSKLMQMQASGAATPDPTALQKLKDLTA